MLGLFARFMVTFWETVFLRLKRGPLRPSWSLSFEWIVRYLRRDWEVTSTWPLPALRAEHERRPYPMTTVKKVTTRDQTLGGVPARYFVPPNAAPNINILYFHGGSYIYGSSKTTHADLLARIALGTGITVIGLEYRLAPEHPFPAQHEDAMRAFEALEGKVLLAGDSAGGNLAIELQLTLRDQGKTQATCAVLISPWSDLEMPGASFIENDPFDYGDRATLVKHAKAYAGGTALSDARVSPVHAKLEGLSPVLVTVGDAEVPRDDILTLATQLKAAGVDTKLHVAKDMPHNAPVFAAYHPNARAALEEIVTFLRARS